MNKINWKKGKLFLTFLIGFLYFTSAPFLYGSALEDGVYKFPGGDGGHLETGSNSGSNTNGGDTGEGIDIRSGEIAVSEAAKAESALREEVAALKKKLAASEEKSEELVKEIAQKEAELVVKEQQRIDAAKKLVAAYDRLAKAYADAGLVGDPVLIGTGEYSYKKEDFIAEDFISEFKIYRKLLSDGTYNSFGKNWTCSLDSRIIRGKHGKTDDLQKCINNQKNYIKNLIEKRKALHNFHNKAEDSCESEIESLQQQQIELASMENYVKSLVLDNLSIDERNKFVAYGKYKNNENLGIGITRLLFIDKEGNSNVCEQNWRLDCVEWIPVNKVSAAEFSIIQNENGFTVSFRNGNVDFYDSDGVLYKSQDRCKNEINYYSENGFINRIINKTGEEIFIHRNNEHQITRISGATSGTANFVYSKNLLISVCDNSGIKEQYEYNSEGNLASIIKGADEKIKIEYEYYSAAGKKMVSAVTDPLGNKEKFIYYPKSNKVNHIDYSGFSETYQLDDSGATIEYTNSKGIHKKFQFNEDNQISAVFENKEWKYFYYNDFYEPVKTVFADGCSSITQYNQLGQISFQSDKDGFTNEVIYDEYGNVLQTKYCDFPISNLTYYKNGLIKTVEENDTKYLYQYNDFGKITNRTKINEIGGEQSEFWDYDDNNRLIKYTNPENQILEITYDENTVTEEFLNKKIIHRLDLKKREVEQEQIDLVTGISYKKQITYDKIGRIVQIQLNGKPYVDYEYNNKDMIISYTTWNFEDTKTGIKKEYAYDAKDRIVSESCGYITGKELIQKENLYSVSYADFSDGFKMTVGKGLLEGYEYFYNNKNQLVKIQNPNGMTETRTYTKAGKIDSISTANSYVNFSYHNDGRTTVTSTDKNGFQAVSIYNPQGQLIYQTDHKGNTYSRFYNNDGILIKEINGNCYCLYEYDDFGKLVYEKVHDISGDLCYVVQYEYDEQNRTVKKIEGGKYYSSISYDAWGRITQTQDERGIQNYTYDVLGNLISKTDECGNKEDYKYSLFDEPYESSLNGVLYLEKDFSPSGRILAIKEFGQKKKRWDYDESGNCISIIDELNNQKNFTFDSRGYVTNEYSYESGNSKIVYDIEERKVSIENLKGNVYSSKFDCNNNLIWEQDSLGNNSEYKYDFKNRLIYSRDFEGNTVSVEYEDNDSEEKRVYSDGNEYSVKRNCLGNICGIFGNDCAVYYYYDSGNKLYLIEDKETGISIFYEYDSLGRCIQKKSDSFELNYSYDEIGNLIGVEEKTDNAKLILEYDEFGREKKRKFSNGVVILHDYNNKGQKNLSYAKEPYGLVLTAEITIFDDSGKKKIAADKDGNLIKYEYDEVGRLSSTEYSYNESIIENAKKEAYECGIYFDDEENVFTVMSIDDKDYSEIENLFRKTGSFIVPEKKQKSWKETYAYNEYGSIKSVENLFGKIIYEYDSENRLIQKHSEGTDSGGIHYFWNKNGALVKILSDLKVIEFQYGNFMRPDYIITREFDSGNVYEVFYSYDALGRRISEQVAGGDNHRFIYDGLSDYVLMDTTVFENNKSILKYGNELLFDDSEIGNDFRKVDMWNYEKFNEFRLGTENKKSETYVDEKKGLDFENRPMLQVYVNGTLGASIYFDGSFSNGRDTEFLIMNGTGTEIVATVDKYGNCVSATKYDIWGFPLVGKDNYSGGIGFNNSRHALRVSECIWDLGKRDYIPSMKSFSTKDPAKDGLNWFAYCSCDPVNYRDFNGLEKGCLSEYEKAKYNAGVSKHLLFKTSEYVETGMSAGIHHTYDCADVSSAVDANASEYAKLSGYSARGEKFRQFHLSGNYTKAKEVINSWNFYTRDYMGSFKKTGAGFNRDEYRSSGGKSQVSERQNAYDNLRNPENVTPGTVLVWKNPNHTDNPDDKSWVSHTLTVLARNYDSEGNVIGITYIEGHTGGDKTSIGYMNLTDSYTPYVFSLDAWYGNFLGTYEIESITAHICN